MTRHPNPISPLVRTQLERTLVTIMCETMAYEEITTPCMVPCPGMEPHIEPFAVQPFGQNIHRPTPSFLRTSPEFAMKKFLALWSTQHPKIIQAGPVFRVEPDSPEHLEEFRMLEWYACGSSLDAFIDETIHLIQLAVLWSEATFGVKNPSWNGTVPKISARDLILKHTQIDIELFPERDSFANQIRSLGLSVSESDNWDDLYHRLFLNFVDPALRANQEPIILCEFPASQASLARTKQNRRGALVAERFELLWGGRELCNGFHELNDAQEQSRRFEADMRTRKKAYGDRFPETPVDQEFLQRLPSLPDCMGNALGIERLAMCLFDIRRIQNLEPILNRP